MRSDRAQNTRTEALNLIRGRKGNTPLIVAVTFEPLPSRIASLAMGTGDLDCTYHGALNELLEAVIDSGTARALKNPNYSIAGKTGTTQNQSEDIGQRLRASSRNPGTPGAAARQPSGPAARRTR